MATRKDSPDKLSVIPVKSKFKMALLGITGSGKTSLIDLIGNYGKRSRDIDFLKKYRKTEFEDTTGEMESKTNLCVSYDMTINGVLMEIIDTPGLQDSRGAKQSQENIENIISTLKDCTYINCICLVSNGRSPRFDEVTQKAITDILSILPQEMKKNTIIVYTNTSSPKDISSEHKKIREELGFSSLKAFMLDNAYCGCIKLGQEKDSDLYSPCDEKTDKERLQVMLHENFKCLDNMFKQIKSMKSVPTDCFGDLRRISDDIKFKYMELKALERSKDNLEEQIKSLANDLKSSKEGISVIKSRLDFVRTNVIKTNGYNTLCDADECFKNCHAPCIYTGMFYRRVKECRCIKKDGYCNVCGHHYTIHTHCQFIFNEEEVKLRSNLKEELSKAKTEEESATALLAEQKFQLEELNYVERKMTTRSEIAILLAEFQRISSKSSYEKIIDKELIRFTKYFDNFLQIPKKELLDYLGLTTLREGLIEIQHIPFSDDMTEEDKHVWACKTLDIDPDAELTPEKIDQAFRAESRKYLDIIKEGDEAIQKRQVLARDILKKCIN